MILPITAYGSSVLRRKCLNISKDYKDLDNLISNMWETMYNANGVGIAAPQINKSIRIFMVDTTPFFDDDSNDKYNDEKIVKQVFINAKIIKQSGEFCDFNEGCLSIPDVREIISRKSEIIIEYEDENFNFFKVKYSGLSARVIQHEYDHIEGVLFTDKVSFLRKKMIKGKLLSIKKGNVDVSYKMRYFK